VLVARVDGYAHEKSSRRPVGIGELVEHRLLNRSFDPVKRVLRQLDINRHLELFMRGLSLGHGFASYTLVDGAITLRSTLSKA
jgi:hypothetical protein